MHPWLIQWYEYTGTSGGTVWLLGINILWYESRLKTSGIARAVQAGQASVEQFRSAAIKASLPAWAWMVLPAALSIYMYNSYGEDRGEAVNVALLQTDFDPHTEKFDLPWSTVLDSMVSQSGRALENAEEPVDLLVWPETAVTYSINLNNLDRDHAMRALQGLQAASPQTSLLVGITSFQRFESPEGLDGDVIERFYSSGKKVYELRYNTALYLDSTGQTETYFKGILVPGPERYPYREQLKFLDKVVPGMKNYMGRLSVSRERSALGEGNREMGPAICYESIFGEFMTGFVEDGAKLLFVITNDGWWGNSNGRKQHLAYARLRAIETRRNVARSANTGISCFIDQRGEVVSAVPVNTSGVLIGTMYANDELTTFVRLGDVLGRTSLWITMLALLLFIARRQMSKSVI
jgi:apolipoprotein N-acyltransferase